MERPATFVRNPIDSLRGRGKCRRITPTQKRQLVTNNGSASPKKLLIVISEPTDREDDTQNCEGGGTVSPTHESFLQSGR